MKIIYASVLPSFDANSGNVINMCYSFAELIWEKMYLQMFDNVAVGDKI